MVSIFSLNCLSYILFSTKRSEYIIVFISYIWFTFRHEGIDIIVIREQTEGEYSSLEHEVGSNNFHFIII